MYLLFILIVLIQALDSSSDHVVGQNKNPYFLKYTTRTLVSNATYITKRCQKL